MADLDYEAHVEYRWPSEDVGSMVIRLQKKVGLMMTLSSLQCVWFQVLLLKFVMLDQCFSYMILFIVMNHKIYHI